MDFATLLLLALGLCFDSFAVSFSCGMAARGRASGGRMCRFAAVLAVCQGVAPLVGWMVAANFRSSIEAYDHWVAFVLLAVLGGKMIADSCKGETEGEEGAEPGSPFAWRRNVTLGIATSIDAVAAGMAMAMLPLRVVPSDSQWGNMAAAATVIAIVTLAASSAGLLLGRHGRERIGDRTELIGGVILVLIGVKVLAEHLWGE